MNTNIQINSLTLSHPIDWFKSGWTIFINNPLQWVLILVVFFICSLICGLIPLLGSFIFLLISPALIAGIFLATEKSAQGHKIDVSDLFSVIKDASQRTPFFLLGLLSLGLNIAVMLLFAIPLMGLVGLQQVSSIEGVMSILVGGTGIISIGLIFAFIIIYIMAMIYAIPLMLFAKQGIKQALILSLKASVSNVLPMFVASIIYFLLIIIAIIPFGLGFFILVPVTFGSLYVSYKDIYSESEVRVF